MSSSSGTGGGGPIRRKSGRFAAKGDGTADSSAEQHGPTHEMHLAIERANDFADVQKLLDKGHSFCRGDGLNCFILLVHKKKHPGYFWDFLLKMLEVDPRGIHVKDPDGLTLLNYFYKDVDKMKKLIELGADLSNVDNSGKTLIQFLQASKFFKNRESLPIWDMLLDHKEIQNQVKGDFFDKLVHLTTKSALVNHEMFCILIKKGFLTVEELTAKLKMHPLFFISNHNYKVASLQLLSYIWKDDPEKKENVAAIGADLNIVDNNGTSLLKCLFNPRVLKSYDRWKSHLPALELWNLLIKRSEIQSQASQEGFFRSLLPLAENLFLVRDMLLSTFELGVWSVEEFTLELKMHPLVFALERAEVKPSKVLKVIKSYPRSFEDKTILITTRVPKVSSRIWQKIKSVLNIPDVLTCGIFGYILFNQKFRFFEVFVFGEEDGVENLSQCLISLLELGFVPSSAAGVVHPIHALLYNILLNSSCNCIQIITPRPRITEEERLMMVLQETITTLKDFPVPHKLVEDPESGTLVLDVQVLISSLLRPALVEDSKANEMMFELIMAVMPLSPCHPLQHFATFFKFSYCYYRHRSKFQEAFCKLLRLTMEASGKHKFQGADQTTIECISRFCESVNIFQMPDEPEEITLHRKAAVKAGSEVGSLKWLSILQVRKTLFLSRSNTTVTLPSLIKGLFADGRLPKVLEADLLVYKSNNFINIFKF